MKNKFIQGTQVYKLKKYLLQKLTLGNQPQLINASRIRSDLKIKSSGRPDFYSNAVNSLRNAEMIKHVGCVRDKHFYVWTPVALNYIKIDPDVIHYWINYGKKWFSKYDKVNFVKDEEGKAKFDTQPLTIDDHFEDMEDDQFSSEGEDGDYF